MSQRDSGYERKELDCYETPEWVTRALMPHLPLENGPMRIWEPACGSGKMVTALANMGHSVVGTDIATGCNFLECNRCPHFEPEFIITNPPYSLADEFIKHAIALMRPPSGVVAMLLRADFDHANSRRPLFKGSVPFAKKIALTKRIRWFEDSKGSPSFNHAWFVFDWKHQGPPTLAYGP